MDTRSHVTAAVRMASMHFDIPAVVIRGRNRTLRVAQARSFAYWVSRVNSSDSFPELGRIWKRDHTTIMSGVFAFSRFIKQQRPWALEAHRVWLKTV
jgi:chromosomal replication initiation ATPase DnaA